MTYREQIRALGEQAAEQVAAIFTSWQEARISTEEAVDLLAAFIAGANSRAVALADLSLAATLMQQMGVPVATLGLVPDARDVARLHKSARTILAVPDVTLERVQRLARAEPIDAASKAFSEGIKKSPHVTGWVRSVSGSGCELCTWWRRDGQVWPADHPMPTHKGCTCSQVPVEKGRA